MQGVYASDGNVDAATSGGLSISTDGGTSYINYTTSNGLGGNNVAAVYASGSNVYAATNGGGLSISTNGGISFTNYTTANGLITNSVTGVYVSGNNVYASSVGGLNIAQLSDPVPVPGTLSMSGAIAAFGVSRRLRQRLREAGATTNVP